MAIVQAFPNKIVPDIPSVNILEFLSRQNTFALASFLVNEHPQAVAVILSQLHADFSAQVVEHLSPDIQQEVLLRIQRLTSVSVFMMRNLEVALLEEIRNMATDSLPVFVNGAEKAERILANLSSETAAMITEYLQQEDEALNGSLDGDPRIVAADYRTPGREVRP